MIIAIEGPDGCGKTLLSGFVEQELKIPLITNYKFAIGKERNEEGVLAQALTEIPYSKVFNYAHDRFIMTNIVYNLVFGQGKYYKQYLDIIGALDILIIYIYVPFEQLIINLEKRERETREKERRDIGDKLIEIWNAFKTTYIVIEKKFEKKILWVDGTKSPIETAERLNYEIQLRASKR